MIISLVISFQNVHISEEIYWCQLCRWPDDFMNQLKYTPDDVEILVSASGKDVIEQRRERIQQLMEDAYKSYRIIRF